MLLLFMLKNNVHFFFCNRDPQTALVVPRNIFLNNESPWTRPRGRIEYYNIEVAAIFSPFPYAQIVTMYRNVIFTNPARCRTHPYEHYAHRYYYRCPLGTMSLSIFHKVRLFGWTVKGVQYVEHVQFVVVVVVWVLIIFWERTPETDFQNLSITQDNNNYANTLIFRDELFCSFCLGPWYRLRWKSLEWLRSISILSR